MYTLPILGVVAVLLLTRKREFLVASPTIKNPNQWTDADTQAAKTLAGPLATKLADAARAQAQSWGQTVDEASISRGVDRELTFLIVDVWEKVFKPATSPLTPTSFDAYIQSQQGRPPMIQNPAGKFPEDTKVFLNAYFRTSEPNLDTVARPPGSVKDPRTWTDADYDRVKDLSPLFNGQVKKMYDTMMTPPPGAPPSAPGQMQFPEFLKLVITEFLTGFWDDVYAVSPVPLTRASIIAEVNSKPSPPDVTPEFKEGIIELLVKYFAEDGGLSVSPSPVQATSQGSDVTSIATLEANYAALRDEYRLNVNQALQSRTAAELNPILQTIVSLNAQIQEVLNQLVTKLASEETKGNSDFTAKRNELTERLAQIKKDYAGLVSATDRMTTLKRIREFEEKKATSGLKYYLIFFGVAVSLLIVIIFMKMFQSPPKLLATNPIASTPTISPALST
jgi:hypothetical protein